MGDLHGVLRQLRRHVRLLQRGPGGGPDHAGGHLYSRLPAPARGGLAGPGEASGKGDGRAAGPENFPPQGRHPGDPEAAGSGRRQQIPGPPGPRLLRHAPPGDRGDPAVLLGEPGRGDVDAAAGPHRIERARQVPGPGAGGKIWRRGPARGRDLRYADLYGGRDPAQGGAALSQDRSLA